MSIYPKYQDSNISQHIEGDLPEMIDGFSLGDDQNSPVQENLEGSLLTKIPNFRKNVGQGYENDLSKQSESDSFPHLDLDRDQPPSNLRRPRLYTQQQLVSSPRKISNWQGNPNRMTSESVVIPENHQSKPRRGTFDNNPNSRRDYTNFNLPQNDNMYQNQHPYQSDFRDDHRRPRNFERMEANFHTETITGFSDLSQTNQTYQLSDTRYSQAPVLQQTENSSLTDQQLLNYSISQYRNSVEPSLRIPTLHKEQNRDPGLDQQYNTSHIDDFAFLIRPDPDLRLNQAQIYQCTYPQWQRPNVGNNEIQPKKVSKNSGNNNIPSPSQRSPEESKINIRDNQNIHDHFQIGLEYEENFLGRQQHQNQDLRTPQIYQQQQSEMMNPMRSRNMDVNNMKMTQMFRPQSSQIQRKNSKDNIPQYKPISAFDPHQQQYGPHKVGGGLRQSVYSFRGGGSPDGSPSQTPQFQSQDQLTPSTDVSTMILENDKSSPIYGAQNFESHISQENDENDPYISGTQILDLGPRYPGHLPGDGQFQSQYLQNDNSFLKQPYIIQNQTIGQQVQNIQNQQNEGAQKIDSLRFFSDMTIIDEQYEIHNLDLDINQGENSQVRLPIIIEPIEREATIQEIENLEDENLRLEEDLARERQNSGIQKSKISSLEKNLKTLKTENSTAQNCISQCQTQIQELQSDIKWRDKTIEVLNKRIKKADKKIEKQRKLRAQNQVQITNYHKKKQKQIKSLNKQVEKVEKYKKVINKLKNDLKSDKEQLMKYTQEAEKSKNYQSQMETIIQKQKSKISNLNLQNVSQKQQQKQSQARFEQEIDHLKSTNDQLMIQLQSQQSNQEPQPNLERLSQMKEEYEKVIQQMRAQNNDQNQHFQDQRQQQKCKWQEAYAEQNQMIEDKNKQLSRLTAETISLRDNLERAKNQIEVQNLTILKLGNNIDQNQDKIFVLNTFETDFRNPQIQNQDLLKKELEFQILQKRLVDQAKKFHKQIEENKLISAKNQEAALEECNRLKVMVQNLIDENQKLEQKLQQLQQKQIMYKQYQKKYVDMIKQNKQLNLQIEELKKGNSQISQTEKYMFKSGNIALTQDDQQSLEQIIQNLEKKFSTEMKKRKQLEIQLQEAMVIIFKMSDKYVIDLEEFTNNPIYYQEFPNIVDPKERSKTKISKQQYNT